MKHGKKIQLILFGKIKPGGPNLAIMTLNSWLAGNYIKVAVFERDHSNKMSTILLQPDNLVLLYIYNYRLRDSVCSILSYSIEKLINGDGDFIT